MFLAISLLQEKVLRSPSLFDKLCFALPNDLTALFDKPCFALLNDLTALKVLIIHSRTLQVHS